MIDDILGQIVGGVRKALEDGHYDVEPLDDGPRSGHDHRATFTAALERDAPEAFLAEVKPASPTAGPLMASGQAADIDGEAVRRATTYRDYGATAISVLTERERFGGSPQLLRRIAAIDGGPPVLMKDFIIDERQLDAARATGASAVLFIDHLFRRGLTSQDIDDMLRAAHERDLAVLYEVDNRTAFDHARGLDVDAIGINNRDLTTLEMDPYRTQDILRFRQDVAARVPVLALSGIENREDVRLMAGTGARGVLVGTSLMQATDLRRKLRGLRGLVHIKCCGTGDPEDEGEVMDALQAADAVGVVVDAAGATRERSVEEAQQVFRSLPPGVERLVVTTQPDAAKAAAVVEATGATGLQWHVAAKADEVAALRGLLPDATTLAALVRAPAEVHSEQQDAVFEQAKTIAPHVDRILLEAPVVDGSADAQGGTGTAVDVGFARRFVHALDGHKVVLAGGLHADNVAAVVRKVRPWGVDVSSGIERMDAEGRIIKGRKDAVAISRFLRAARTVAGVHDPVEAKRLPMAHG